MALSAQDKENIYTLLKTAKTYSAGYLPKEFKEEMPVFADDTAKNNKESSFSALQKIPLENIKTSVSENPHTVENPQIIENTQIQEKTSAITLDVLAQKVQNCHNCQLEKSKSQNSSGAGCAHPLLLVVTLLPLSENACILLEKMLSSICLNKTLNCFVTSLIKCEGEKIKNPLTDEITSCKAYLDAQVHILKPKYILSLGQKTSQALLKTDYPLEKLRGKVWGCRLGNRESDPVLPLVTSFDPEELIKEQSKKALAWQDLKMLRTKLAEKFTEYKNILSQAK